MHGDSDKYGCSPSTTWEWRRVKIRTAPQALAKQRPKGSPFKRLTPWPPRRRLTVTVAYRGGPECWWEISARGVTVYRPGVTALHDLLREIERLE